MSNRHRSALILASASPRRLDLLRQIGIEPAGVRPADVDETPRARELPRDVAARLAQAKAQLIADQNPDSFIVGADTVVACGRRILGKAETLDEARAFLKLLSGRRHTVIGGVCVCTPDGRSGTRVVETTVTFKRLTSSEIDAYLATDEWQGKAGAYAIQGRAALFVKFLRGSYSNVVGLPLFETAALLRGYGFQWDQSDDASRD